MKILLQERLVWRYVWASGNPPLRNPNKACKDLQTVWRRISLQPLVRSFPTSWKSTATMSTSTSPSVFPSLYFSFCRCWGLYIFFCISSSWESSVGGETHSSSHPLFWGHFGEGWTREHSFTSQGEVSLYGWPHVLLVWIQLLCICLINSRFICSAKSKPVKQEVSCIVIPPLMK